MDIRAQRTRNMLKAALRELLSEKAFEDISVSEICELSTVRRGTFYRHFDDKLAFYEWYLQTITEEFLDELGMNGESDDLRTYASLMHRELIEFVKANASGFRHMMGKSARVGSLDMVMRQASYGITDHIRAFAEENGIELDASPEFISMFYSGGMVHTLRLWILNDEPCSADELERNCTEFLMRYLGC